MKSIHFIFGVHNHQPVGNFDFIFEEAYRKAYLPFLETLEAHPRIRLMYHTTGPLLDWLEEKHPDFSDRVARLAENGQIELMTGGYYEPILAVLPDRDKVGQIRMMSDYLRRRFGVQPQGMWMAERVWEPHLAKSLKECGVDYITLDDYHFHAAGLDPDTLRGYYRTDEQGYAVSVFPISMRLRYLIPFSQPEEALAYLRGQADEEGENLLVMCDDGEKFGLWPGTYDWVHKKGWLKRFFTLLEKAMDEGWLELTTAGKFAAEHPARGRVYLPCASYFEMSQWALPADSAGRFSGILQRLKEEGRLEETRPFLKGGFWRNFIARYDESNRMLRKALWVSDLIVKTQAAAGKSGKTDELLAAARRHLYRGQCNCAYWHGVFGGLYLPHLRHAVYQNLLAAEDLCLQAKDDGQAFQEISTGEFSADGAREIMLRNRRVNALLAPDKGGSLLELDYLPARFNLLNTLRRQPEEYHRKIAAAGDQIKEGASIHDQVRTKERGLERYLVYDRHQRSALLDHFLFDRESPQSLLQQEYEERGDFADSAYVAEIAPEGKRNTVVLRRLGLVGDQPVDLKKTVTLLQDEDGLDITYRILNVGEFPLEALIAVEFNFALLSGSSDDRYYQDDTGLDLSPLKSVGISEGVRRFSLIDEGDRIAVHFRFDRGTEVWRYPVETVSQSEAGFERVYQSSCVLPVFRLRIGHRDAEMIHFRLLLEKLI